MWAAERSGTTGHPLWLTRSLDPRIGWQVEEREDMADRALEEWDEANTGKKRKKGVSRVAVPFVEGGDDSLLYGGITREQHYLTMALATADLESAAVPDEDDEELDIDRRRPPQGYDASQYG